MTTFSVSNTTLDLSPHALAEAAIARGEAVRSATGALVATTGKRTGRSPKDRFIVQDAITADTVDWGTVNQPMPPEQFDRLWQHAEHYLQGREVYVSQLQVGADAKYGVPVKVITELAWHNLFACHLFIRPDPAHPLNRQEGWTILSAPGLHTDPVRDQVPSDAVLVLNFTERKILLIGLQYAGEIKKAMFTVMNFLMPPQHVLPMHCAANEGKDGDIALFFGLSGTGKTTLSADPERLLIGDDEHGWSATGVFNFEGGCYAKCINLSKASEPMIWQAIRDDAIMENVVLDAQGVPDFFDTHLTENTRAAYPREYISERVLHNAGPIPKAVIFLTCDLYGVLPPVALLTKEQAAYYFLSGYTALVGSTEVGHAKGVSPTFSTCFGAPFFPRRPAEYAQLLIRRIEEAGAQVYLVNTGYTGGSYGKGGERFSIPTTRAVITAILQGQVRQATTQVMPIFNLEIPTRVPGVPEKLLNPVATWADADAYTQAARELAQKFQHNFIRFNVDAGIAAAGPGS